MKEFLRKASKAYYNGEPIIEDPQFDFLVDKYGFDEVGAQEGNVRHLYQMFSLRKLYTDENKHESEFTEFTVETPKLDGASLALVYHNGYLVAATTRGDGINGKDCTHNILAHPNIPNTIPNVKRIQITGEIVCPKAIKNARNVAAGALNLKDIEEFLKRDITFVAYGISRNVQSPSYLIDMATLQEWGFNSITNSSYDAFPQDGIVIRLDGNLIFEKMGYTNKHPRGAFALKERDVEPLAETVLRKVRWQVGKGGRVTPVAIFDEVELSDAKITKATLNNPGFIEDLDLSIGDTILVRRAGGIIPQVVEKL